MGKQKLPTGSEFFHKLSTGNCGRKNALFNKELGRFYTFAQALLLILFLNRLEILVSNRKGGGKEKIENEQPRVV